MKIKIFFLLLLLHFNSIANAQTTSDTLSSQNLPVDSLLFAALHHHYQQQLTAQKAEHQIQEKNKWLKYIPSISFGYALSTNTDGQLTSKLRPSVSFSTNTIYQVHNDRQKRLAKIKTLEKLNHLAHLAAKAELQQLLQSHQLLRQDIQFLKQLHEIDGQLFEIATLQFEAAQLAPSAYLPKKRAFLQKGYEIFKKEQEMEALKQTILVTAKYIKK